MEESSIHEARFPGESKKYRQARDELLRAELELRRQEEAVAAQRRALPLGGEVPEDFEFEEWDAARGKVGSVRLSDLFGDREMLFIYSFMFRPGELGEPLEVPCPVCTSIIDAIDGEIPHLEQQISFALVTKAAVERFAAHARTRGWRHTRLLSSAGNSFNLDYHAERQQMQHAMAHVFSRNREHVHHRWSCELSLIPADPGQNARHVDFMWPLWGILDRTPRGRGENWMPRLSYE